VKLSDANGGGSLTRPADHRNAGRRCRRTSRRTSSHHRRPIFTSSPTVLRRRGARPINWHSVSPRGRQRPTKAMKRSPARSIFDMAAPSASSKALPTRHRARRLQPHKQLDRGAPGWWRCSSTAVLGRWLWRTKSNRHLRPARMASSRRPLAPLRGSRTPCWPTIDTRAPQSARAIATKKSCPDVDGPLKDALKAFKTSEWK